MSTYVHLHVHSHYSLLEALPKVKELIKYALKDGQTALAITDNGVMYSAIEFYSKATEAGLKPIIGMDAYMAAQSRFDKRGKIDSKPYRLVLLAETNEGYKNLVQLSTIGFLEGFYYKPRLDKEVLAKYAKGIICLSGGYQGEVDEALKNGDPEKAKTLIKEYVAIFGEGNYFLELVDRPEVAEQESVNAQLIAIGKELNVPVVATKNTFYIRPGDVEAWKVSQCIKGGKTLEEFERYQSYDFDASFVSAAYMEERFKDTPEAIENTKKIADRCQVKLELGKWNFADYKIPEGKTFLDVLRERAYTEILTRIPEITEEVKTRLDYELSIIEKKGFAPYFLIVSDYITWAEKNGVVTTTRGSAAGSLVGFAIGISSVNPLVYKLPFERFLNPERPSAPDIDGDFADNQRDKMLGYVTEKYGKEKVAQICTFGTMLARGSVRDVGRVLDYPYSYVDKVAKLIPMGSQGFPMTLTRALEETPELKALYDTDVQVRRMIDIAKQIEGCARHVSVHAAGVVMSPTPLTDFTPLQIDTKEGKIITQYEMKSVESAGLLKMDFLGIRNLSILGDAIKLVAETKNIPIELIKIPVDDKKTFDLLAHGHTMGTFQLNGDGMTKYLMELQPARVEDIMAMVALYRPGPIESIPEYIKRKHNPELVTYLDPRMKTIVDQSYGVIVYQDDVMLIAIHLAGYTWLEADKLRKAMGKKIPEEMAHQKEKLMKGFLEHGMSQAKADELWKLIEPFAAYGFNKAHAASYGMVAYHTAYMKANFPAEYMTALMTAECADLEKIAEAVKECQRMGIAVLPPDVNESRSMFTYRNDQTIRFGMVAIKNLGEEVAKTIVKDRDENGPFKDLSDFARRVDHKAFNKKALEALIKAGALDRFGERNMLLANLDRLLLYNKQAYEEKVRSQQTLFDVAPSVLSSKLVLREAPPIPERQRLAWEKELLGLYVSDHPYKPIAKACEGILLPCKEVANQADKAFVKCGGLITTVKKILTKKQDEMAFVGLEDLNGKTEIVVFPKTFAQYKDLLVTDQIVLVSAKVSKRDGEEPALLANSFTLMPDTPEGIAQMVQSLTSGQWVPGRVSTPLIKPRVQTQDLASLASSSPHSSLPAPQPPQGLTIILRDRPDPQFIETLRSLLQAYPGQERVYFLVRSTAGERRVMTDYSITRSEEFLQQLRALVGSSAVM